MIKNYIKLYLTRKNTLRNGMFCGHTKLFRAYRALAAPCTFYPTAVYIRYRNKHSAFNIDLISVLDLITATDEKPASHKYDVAKGIRIQRALQLTSENLNQAIIQKEVIESRL